MEQPNILSKLYNLTKMYFFQKDDRHRIDVAFQEKYFQVCLTIRVELLLELANGVIKNPKNRKPKVTTSTVRNEPNYSD